MKKKVMKKKPTAHLISCDNDTCIHNKKGECTTDVKLTKTWVGSEKYYKLKCETAVDK